LDRDFVDGVVINDRVVFVSNSHEYANLSGLKNISDLVPRCDKELRLFWSDRQSDIE